MVNQLLFLCSIVEEQGEDSKESPRASSLAAAEDKDSSKRDAIEGNTTEKDSSKTFSFVFFVFSPGTLSPVSLSH